MASAFLGLLHGAFPNSWGKLGFGIWDLQKSQKGYLTQFGAIPNSRGKLDLRFTQISKGYWTRFGTFQMVGEN